VNADAGTVGEAIDALNVYHTPAVSMELVRLRGNAAVSKDGEDSSVIKVHHVYTPCLKKMEPLCN